MRLGWISFEFDIASFAIAPTSWVLALVASLMLIGLCIVGHSWMHTSLTDSLSELEEQRARLENEVAKRKLAEERFRAVFDNVPIWLSLRNLDGRYLLVNKHYADRLGKTVEEIVGKLTDEVHDSRVAEASKAQLREAVETGEVVQREIDYRDAHGTLEKSRFVVKFPIRDDAGEIVAVGSATNDITERKRAEGALRDSEQRITDVVEAASDWFWEMDKILRFTFFSDRRQQLTGLSPQKNIGKTRWEVADADPDNDEKWRQHRATLEAHKPFRDFEYAFTSKDGKTAYNKVSGRPVFDANGAFKGYRGAATEITEQKKAQAQLIQASKLATLGEMASGIAHEINQPLSVMGMSAELSLMSMEEGAFDVEFVRKKLQTIVGQRDRMAEIIDHMRLFSRRDKAELESFDPLQSVSGAVRLIDKQFHASGIDLEEDFPVSSRPVSGHPAQLEQVVLNLLTNARDAVIGKMDGGGPGGRRIAPKVRVSLVDDKRRKTVVISVADNGVGIPEAALERVFDPFFTTKTEGHGTGLGLSISYSIIDTMGGRLEARNTEDGAVFRISLPVPADGAGAVDRGKGKKRKTRIKRSRARLPRVLVVDDEEAIVEEMAEYLRRKGYDVVTAGNAREALKVHTTRPADVVVTDLFMPGMGGNELIRRLRRSDPELPIVVVTGHTSFGDDQDIVAEAASVVLKKPIVLRELTESLKGLRQR